jgi:HAMP domain-containing protein
VTSPSAHLDEEQILAALVAAKRGDFSARMPAGAVGTAGRVAETFNGLMEQLNTFASESNRIAREIGVEGRYGCQAVVPGLSGAWKDMVDSLNTMASNLTVQVRDLAATTDAVANGRLARKISVDAAGEMLELKTTINIMLDQLDTFASEITQVAREIGTEGKLGGQAELPGASGTWQGLVESINLMSFNLTGQIRNLSDVSHRLSIGDLSKRVTVDARGEVLDLKAAVNALAERLADITSQRDSRPAAEPGDESRQSR